VGIARGSPQTWLDVQSWVSVPPPDVGSRQSREEEMREGHIMNPGGFEFFLHAGGLLAARY